MKRDPFDPCRLLQQVLKELQSDDPRDHQRAVHRLLADGPLITKWSRFTKDGRRVPLDVAKPKTR